MRPVFRDWSALMSLRAKLQPRRGLSGDRAEPRHTLKLLTSARTARGDAANVVVLDLSTTGVLIQADTMLDPGDSIEVQLPGSTARRATVEWSSGTYHGCSFDAPLAPAAVSAALLRSLPGRSDSASALPHPAQGSPKDFAARLAAGRDARGWTMEELAQRLGVSRQAVWYWESGQRLPRSTAIARIAAVLDLNFADLSADVAHVADVADEAKGLTQVSWRMREELAARLGCEPDQIRISIEL
jgi:DNA-binding XRE family transcriptional regulator